MWPQEWLAYLSWEKIRGRELHLCNHSNTHYPCWGRRSSAAPVRKPNKAICSPGWTPGGIRPWSATGTLGGGVDIAHISLRERMLPISQVLTNQLSCCLSSRHLLMKRGTRNDQPRLFVTRFVSLQRSLSETKLFHTPQSEHLFCYINLKVKPCKTVTLNCNFVL